MKIKYLFTGLLAAAISLAGCGSPDELVYGNNDNMLNLVVKGRLMQDENIEYDAVIDPVSHIVTVQVPYYISDTDPIMSDLSQMKLRATMPLGARFEPGLAGVLDLSEGKTFAATLVYENGQRVGYTFGAVRVKSSACALLDVKSIDESTRVTIGITEPAVEGEKGKIAVMNTSASISAAIEAVKMTVSPWATLSADAGYDAASDTYDLNVATEVTVTAHNGVDKTVYAVSIETPALVPLGQAGYISSMFGFQFNQNDSRGFAPDANYTLAVIDDYLIVSNARDFTKMVVLNRFSGLGTGKSVNVAGIDSKFAIRAIASDDAGHLVAMTYTCTRENDASATALGYDLYKTDPTVMIWVWKNGFEQAPTPVVNANIAGGAFSGMATKPQEIGNTICVRGDMTAGNAVCLTSDKFCSRQYAFYFVDGRIDSYVMECPAKPDGSLVWAPNWNSTKAIPLAVAKPLPYLISASNQYQTVMLNSRTADPVTLNKPTSYWWAGSGAYDKDTRGIDYIEFHGMNLLAVSNGFVSGSTWAHRLYVANITAAPSADALKNGFIFDSREDGSGRGIIGTGYAVTGMTSTTSFDGTPMIGGTNEGKRGDVVFGRGTDGNSVQVYMLTANAGIFAYEITNYDI